jgi:malonyl-CoA/methylmalonyl-CoA synthetase
MPASGWTAHLPDPGQPVDVLAGGSLTRVWRRRWEDAPAAPALATPDGRVIANAELEEATRGIAGCFAAAGLVPGDRLIVSGGPTVDLVTAYVAALRMGLVVVPLNRAYSLNEVRHAVRNTAPSAAVVDSREFAAMVEASAEGPCRVFGLPVTGPSASGVDLDTADRDTPALICHTSGTTGVPKGAVLTSGNLLASAEAVRIAWRWSPEDRLLLALPLFHLHGLGVGINGTLAAGASALVMGGFDAEAVAGAAKDRAGSMFFGVPTMYHRLVRSGAARGLSSLRLCVCGSAPLSADLHAGFATASGQRILERYGMTETVMNVSNPYVGERRAGTVGFPLPGVEVRLASDTPDGPGEIEVRGPNVFAGYWNMDAATREAFTADGWLRSGDVGRWDDAGYLRIVGRSKELIISGGYNVYPREVEDVLTLHPAIAEVAVVGIPSEEWGETVVAFVVVADAVPADDLIAFAAERLASYKRPRQIRFVDRLPRNALGKIIRDQLVP